MDIIYNESKAIESYQKHESKKKKRITFLIIGVVFILLASILDLLIFGINRISVPSCIAGGIVISLNIISIILEKRSPLPPDAAYYVISQSYKILEVFTHQSNFSKKAGIYVKIEDEDGFVYEKRIGQATIKETTRVSNKTLDLHQGIVLKPYTGAQPEVKRGDY